MQKFVLKLLSAILALQAALSASAQTDPNSDSAIANASLPNGTITSVVGNGYSGTIGIGGPAAAAQLVGPGNVVFDKHGNLFISDFYLEQIFEVSASTGKITVFAGTGGGGYSGDGGPATKATFHNPQQLAFGPDGSLYIADSNNNAIRRVDAKTGIISTVAGNGVGAGPSPADVCGKLILGRKATKTAICNPLGIAFDRAGNLYIDSIGNILKVDASTDIVSNVAGNGSYGYTGDGGPAIDAELSWVGGIAVGPTGNIFIADSGNCAIRKVNVKTGIITSLVGVPLHPWQGTCGLTGLGGPASAASIRSPFGIYVDAGGNVFFSDNGDHMVDVIAVKDGKLYQVAGSYTGTNGNGGFSGDGGPSIDATLYNPDGITLDSSGNLYIADQSNGAIRKVTKPAAAYIP